jgi:hypothetical protein
MSNTLCTHLPKINTQIIQIRETLKRLGYEI